jgi:anti-sigma28 factor (negative regulator of flagellin synthesis)
MEVNGLGSVQGASPIRAVRPAADAAKPAETNSMVPRDEVEISSVGKMMDELSRSGDVRAERLAQIKAAIDAGTYETVDKLEAALGRLLDEIGVKDE